ncbi:hypothetical protein OG735_21655 [Streptomyces sp. NBC_01210]|uniref:hypothetical protein n=1 Tax=Streptomyces sp. NBC_01210 TaxID=2903774 RepID=UPI002E0E523D|nr:hypothetical protein OG735_21655 [Streptomyces sp. NBC_01210]
MRNLAAFGSVDADRRHHYLAAREFARADRGRLEGLVTRRVAQRDIDQALDRDQTGIKVIVDFTS